MHENKMCLPRKSQKQFSPLRIGAICALILLLGFSIFNHNIAQPSEEGNTQNETSSDHQNSFTEVDTLLPSLDIQKDTATNRWRNIVDSSPKSLSLKRDLNPGESVFIGVQLKRNNSVLTPVWGLHMPENTKEKTWLNISMVPPPFEDPKRDSLQNMARFFLFYVIKKENIKLDNGIDWAWHPDGMAGKKVQFFTPRLIHIPVNISKTTMYVAPFAKYKEKTYSLLIAITKDRTKLKEHLHISDDDPHFNWEDWFHKIE